ncbi:hypothetical protein Q5P01_000211 [Channa striata]|uniref:Uncharacterized protein n=1 Tax=Channa striata TaxID=64152 RepID=A0AA88LEB7_CHASR|nr:hypothetical protein Q5P01_000211 [Channa striata]
MLTTKTKASTAGYREAYELCLDLWDEGLSSVLAGPRGEGADRGERGGDGDLPAACEMASMRGHEVLLRLALLADFYRYQAEDLLLDEVRSARKLVAIRREAFRLLCSCALIQRGQGVRPRRAASDPSATPPRTEDAVEPGAGDLRERARPRSPEPPAAREDSVKWSRFCFATRNKSYYAKLTRSARTSRRPLEMAAACLPQLREAAAIVSLEQFHKLGSLSLECQMLLYAVLSCHINWVDYNHKQILLQPERPGPLAPNLEGDLRCLRCLKNQTFRSSEVKGNPKNIDVEFDFERMRFVSSCCAAPMVNVPLSTPEVNTCTFTDLKQMYTACPVCKQPIFSEVLVDPETLYTRCAVCSSTSESL